MHQIVEESYVVHRMYNLTSDVPRTNPPLCIVQDQSLVFELLNAMR